MSILDNWFGFKILKNKETESSQSPTFSPELSDDGSFPISSVAGFYGTFIDIEGLSRSETELVRRYREISLYPEVDLGIQDIVNEAICEDSEGEIVKIDLEDVEIEEKIKPLIQNEFEEILDLLNFHESGSDIFRRWYVDGKLYYQILFDKNNIKRGITGFHAVDATKMKKIVEYLQDKDPKTGVSTLTKSEEFFIYSDQGFGGVGSQNPNFQSSSATGNQIKISKDSILYCSSGLSDPNTQNVLSYLHTAIRPANQLRMMEDSIVIYRLSRASERRVFKIPVGHLPKPKQEQYMRSMIAQYRNKMVYDGKTGEIRDDKKFMSMQEDLWLPVYGDGKSADITTLPGAQALDKISDVEYFRGKLYQALNVPISRLEQGTGFSLGRTTEITRDEIKFYKFISKLRRKFSHLFLEALKIQCIFKGIMTIEEWEDIQKDIKIIFAKDNNFVELKDMEIINDRLELLGKIDDYIGTYFSREYAYKKVLGFTESEIREIEAQIEKERTFNPQEYKPAPVGSGGGLGGDLGGLGGGGGPDIDFGSDIESPEETPEGPETTETPEPTDTGEVTFSPPNKQ